MTKKLKQGCLLVALLLATVEVVVARDNRFYVYNAADGLADNSAQTVHCTKTGRLVITTMGQINFYDGLRFSFIDPTTENIYPLNAYNGNYHLYFDRHHHIWLKNRHTLSCVDLLREQFARSIVDEFKALGMTDQVLDLFADSDNALWLLTGKGLYCVETQKTYPVRQKHSLQDMETYQDKYLLLFYEDGTLDAAELSTGETVYSSQPYDKTQAARYKESSVVYEEGSHYYQIRNGAHEAVLLRFDISKWEWETLLTTPYHMSNFAREDSLLYIPTEYGYWTYEIPSGRLEHVEKLKMANGTELLTDMNAIAFDRQGGMWIGTEKRGLLYARPIASPFHVYDWSAPEALHYAQQLDQTVKPQYKYRDKSVNCVFRDSRGWDWVGTSSGLQLYQNKQVKLPQLITRSDGLLNNVIHCIAEDGAHNIWVGTSYGISCIFLKGNKVRYINSYNQWDKIPSESFVNGRSMRLPDGTIVMQALDHVVAFNPDKMATVTEHLAYEIYPKLVKLLVNGNDVKTGQKLDGKVILEKALTRTKTIDLDYNQNSLSLTFSGLNYFRPQQTYYRVRLTGPGMAGKWTVYTQANSHGQVDTRGQLHLPLMALQPGTYTIEVQTSMLPDTWNTTPYEWVVNVNEPWWRTTGIIALLGLLLSIMLAVYLYLFLRNANMKARRNSEEQGILKRIKSFAERCSTGAGLEAQPEEAGQGLEQLTEFSPEFVKVMTTIQPIVLSTPVGRLSMRELGAVAGLPLKTFYPLITSNIYKNPRPIALQIALARAEKLLKDSPHMSVGEIAQTCGFASPNFFIASFFHRFRMLPEEYRNA